MEPKSSLQGPSPPSQKRVLRGRCGAERKQVNNGHPWGGQVPSPGSCLTEGLFNIPWGEKMNKCGHVIYLEGIPIMKTGDAQLCQVEQMSGELGKKKKTKGCKTELEQKQSIKMQAHGHQLRVGFLLLVNGQGN